MDVKQCMIVDLEKRGDKRMFVTESVVSIRLNSKGFWSVQFSSSARIFNYNTSRLLYLTHPEVIDIKDKGLYIDNRHITDVRELLSFSDEHHCYYHVTYNNGYYENLEAKRVYVTRTPIDKNGGSTWQYLNKLAAETGLLTDDQESLLAKQYELVDVMRDNVPLAQFLGDPMPLKTYRLPGRVYYPFGCNASQKIAVEQALTHQVSIIQGPPGTGKTQTILNIIANLLVEHKTVLVVSNNNSAVENVAEKLSAVELGFLVAQLGSVENKESFIAHQCDYPGMDEWILDDRSQVEQISDVALQQVVQGFQAQYRQAELKAMLSALQKEEKYNLMQTEDAVEQEWLDKKTSARLLKILQLYQRKVETEGMPGFWSRLRWAFSFGVKMFVFLQQKPELVIAQLEEAYYRARLSEISNELTDVSALLQEMNIEKCVAELRRTSLLILKNSIANRYRGGQRRLYKIGDIKNQTLAFLQDYPIVLSTTYSTKSNISKDMVFDYVIMDEASQVDLKTGALALSCAMNAVIVGDDKQLPNVISQEEATALNAIHSTYDVDESYNPLTHSFLQSCTEVFREAPSTLLREHYRCHPKIIDFCNQRFYDKELMPMTTDSGEQKVLKVVRTVAGNHARGHYNQREIDVICQEVIPEYEGLGSIGIITPYRLQAEEINKTLGEEIASTVHKFQGRECDTIIMSMVDNQPTPFSDDPNLLNVAISRAKKHLCVVTNGNEMDQDSILSQLISYVQYHNFEVKESRLHSVFDLLYRQYTSERLAYEAAHLQTNEYLSESLVYDLLSRAITKQWWTHTSLLAHYPLSRLVVQWEMLDEQEKNYARNALSHVDFLIYNTLTKQPRLAVEVDGWHFHRESDVQQSRDALKDQILEKIGLPLRRISTTDTVNETYVVKLLSTVKTSGTFTGFSSVVSE